MNARILTGNLPVELQSLDSTQSVFPRTLVTIKFSFGSTFMEFEKRSSYEIGIKMQKGKEKVE